MAWKRKILGMEESGKEVLVPPDDDAEVTVKKVKVEPKVEVLEEGHLKKVEAKVNEEVLKVKDEGLEEGVNPTDMTEDDGDEDDTCMDIDKVGALTYEEAKRRNVELNRKRLEELGLFDASKQLSSTHRTMSHIKAALKANRRTSTIKCQLQVGFQPRRSLRLEGSKIPSFRVKDLFRSKGELRGYEPRKRRATIELGATREEIYSEEHVKALGSYEKEWELFRDGFEGGKRIYDSERGKTCHQCRQKTLGHRTSCSSCKARCGEFCGDCLFQRYGENVLEAKVKPDWVCPVCRGICNCSICRVRRGWAPTGCIYRTVLAKGFKSVAHYLVLTRRDQPTSEGEQVVKGEGNCGGQPANEDEQVVKGEGNGEDQPANEDEQVLKGEGYGEDQPANEDEQVVKGEGNDGEDRLDESAKDDGEDCILQPSTPSPSRRIPRSASKVDSCSAVDNHKAERQVNSKLPRWARQLGIKSEGEEIPSPLSLRRSPRLKKKEEERRDESNGDTIRFAGESCDGREAITAQVFNIPGSIQGAGPPTGRRVMSPGDSLECPSLHDDTCPPLRTESYRETKKSLFVTKETTMGATPRVELSGLVEASTGHQKRAKKSPGRTQAEVARQRLILKSKSDLAPTLEISSRVEPMCKRLRKKEIINYKSFL